MSEALAEREGRPDLLRGFIGDCLDQNLSKRTIESYRSSIRHFLAFMERRSADPLRIGREDLRAYLRDLRERDLSPVTAANHFHALSSFYDYLAWMEFVPSNPVPAVRKRYLRAYKSDYRSAERRAITVEQLAAMVNGILDPRDRALVLLLAKAGLRRSELINIDVEDVNWAEGSVTLKPSPKRSNRVAFFDDEARAALLEWVEVRRRIPTDERALFVTFAGRRIDRTTVWTVVRNHAARAGLCKPGSERPEERFGPHWLRHWFTTWLIRNGCPREYVKELRGDARGREAVDIYHHIDREELKRAYLAAIPQLGLG